jgi:CheY-like chemotaxis protein
METGSGSKKKSILVVDDESDILKSTSFVLKKEGYDVATAGDGSEAMEIVRQKKFDLVFLDVVMPDVDGFEFFKKIRLEPGMGNIPIIVVSGRSGMADTFLAMGADGFVVKPMAISEIVSKADEFTRDKALMLVSSSYLSEKLLRIFVKQGYEALTVEDEGQLVNAGKNKRYKCVIAHLSLIKSSPEQFVTLVKSSMKYKDPTLLIYSDSTVKGLEGENTLPIEEMKLKWKRSGVTFFYDPRVESNPFTVILKNWLSG